MSKRPCLVMPPSTASRCSSTRAVAAQVPKVPGQVVLTAPRTVVRKLRRVVEGAKAAAAE